MHTNIAISNSFSTYFVKNEIYRQNKKKFDKQTKQNNVEKNAIEFLRQTINFNFFEFSMCITFHIVLILLMRHFKFKKMKILNA